MTANLAPIDPAATTILFGAGVTCGAGGPTAHQLINAIAESFVEDPDWRKWISANMQPAGSLRFETAMDELVYTADPELRVLRFFNLLKPGRIHRTMARGIIHGARLVTVNFDNLAEAAIASEGMPAWTVDAQSSVNIDRAQLAGAVVKLHGTQGVNQGGAEIDEAVTPLHATISKIVSAGGGAGLAPRVEDLLVGLIDGRTLLIIGYSGSDDLDVMPSLSRSKPARVVWTQHDKGETERHSHSTASPSVRNLLEQWVSSGCSVDLVSGETEAVLMELGLQVDQNTEPAGGIRWQFHVQEWATEYASLNDPGGLGWVAQLAASNGEFRLAHRALTTSHQSGHYGAMRSEQRIMLELAENEHLNDQDPVSVRARAAEAFEIPEASNDHQCMTGAQVLIARTYVAERKYAAAEHALSLAGRAATGRNDAPNVANVQLWTARLAMAQGEYRETALGAVRAADQYRAAGDWRLVSEALQLAGHALSLAGDKDSGRALLDESSEIARKGPYPERQIACHMAMAMLADTEGDIAQMLHHAGEAIGIALRTRHEGELAQAHTLNGLAQSECGLFSDAADSFEKGLAALNHWTETLRDTLVCGLADSLFHMGRAQQALELLSQNQSLLNDDPRRCLHAEAIRWRAGTGTKARVARAAEEVESSDAIPDTLTVFAIRRLGVSDMNARKLVERARIEASALGQTHRLARLDSITPN